MKTGSPDAASAGNTLHLVRHGQSDWNLAQRLQGQRDEPVLTDLGAQQAAEAARQLRGYGPTAILASDLRRTAQTAEIIGTALTLPVRLDQRLREQSLGKIEGMSMQAALDATEGHDWTDADATIERGESLRDVAIRVLPLIEEIAAGAYGSHVVLVSHGDTIRVALTILADYPGVADLAGVQYRAPANGSVTSVRLPRR